MVAHQFLSRDKPLSRSELHLTTKTRSYIWALSCTLPNIGMCRAPGQCALPDLIGRVVADEVGSPLQKIKGEDRLFNRPHLALQVVLDANFVYEFNLSLKKINVFFSVIKNILQQVT